MIGYAKAKVKKIIDIKDINKLKQGEIMASYATNPNLVPVMHKASAIITEEGGLTCHAAVFAREFKIPCVVGVKDLIQLVEDSDLIEVDANNGIVKILD